MPRLIPYNARWHKIKFALRVVSFVLAIVLLGLGIKALSFDVYPAIWFFIFAMTIVSVPLLLSGPSPPANHDENQ